MALKENMEAIKREIGIEEKFLEGFMKTEYFFKKYKKYIVFSAITVVVAGVMYVTSGIIKESRAEASNSAYSKLLKDPNDSVSKSILKEKNERLYNFYRLQMALESDDIKTLKELSEYKNDPVISDLALYQFSSIEGKNDFKSELLHGFIILQEGYKLLQEDRVSEAKLKFAQIEMNSPLKNVSDNLEHYQGTKLKKVAK
ncbi:MAG: hypothetical protein JJV95_06015 [Sulfurospirillum sp.]|nr:hypothetical protein [Sulfurospirillum sp.]MBL0703521.1 hypothetical protein [Sulfurospirillum sp.]